MSSINSFNNLEISEDSRVNSKDSRVNGEFVIEKVREDSEIIIENNIANESITEAVYPKTQKIPGSCRYDSRNNKTDFHKLVALEDENKALATGIFDTPIEPTVSSQKTSDSRGG